MKRIRKLREAMLFFVALSLVLFAGVGHAAEFEIITPGDTATGITAAVKKPVGGDHAAEQATGALVTVEANSINFTVDGSTPTAAAGTNIGHQMDAGQSYYLPSAEAVNNFKCIDRVSGSASKVKVTCYFKID